MASTTPVASSSSSEPIIQLPRSIVWRLRLGLLQSAASAADASTTATATLNDVIRANRQTLQDEQTEYEQWQTSYQHHFSSVGEKSTEKDISTEEGLGVTEDAAVTAPAIVTATASEQDEDPLTAMLQEQEAQEGRRRALDLKYRKEKARQKRGIQLGVGELADEGTSNAAADTTSHEESNNLQRDQETVRFVCLSVGTWDTRVFLRIECICRSKIHRQLTASLSRDHDIHMELNTKNSSILSTRICCDSRVRIPANSRHIIRLLLRPSCGRHPRTNKPGVKRSKRFSICLPSTTLLLDIGKACTKSRRIYGWSWTWIVANTLRIMPIPTMNTYYCSEERPRIRSCDRSSSTSDRPLMSRSRPIPDRWKTWPHRFCPKFNCGTTTRANPMS